MPVITRKKSVPNPMKGTPKPKSSAKKKITVNTKRIAVVVSKKTGLKAKPKKKSVVLKKTGISDLGQEEPVFSEGEGSDDRDTTVGESEKEYSTDEEPVLSRKSNRKQALERELRKLKLESELAELMSPKSSRCRKKRSVASKPVQTGNTIVREKHSAPPG